NTKLARRAFNSYMWACATHPSNEKHLPCSASSQYRSSGRSFALREAPETIT
ncbi:hypothetical protein BDR07DRAFT_1177336, partial [Suillus spraguei]